MPTHLTLSILLRISPSVSATQLYSVCRAYLHVRRAKSDLGAFHTNDCRARIPLKLLLQEKRAFLLKPQQKDEHQHSEPIGASYRLPHRLPSL